MQAMHEMQGNPSEVRPQPDERQLAGCESNARACVAEQAAQKYQNDKQVSEFLREFMGLMGDHFGNLADEADAKERKEAAPAAAPGGGGGGGGARRPHPQFHMQD